MQLYFVFLEKGNAKDFIAATQPTVLMILDSLFNYIGEAILSNDVDFRITNYFSKNYNLHIKSLLI